MTNVNIPKERPIENYADWANWIIGNKEKLESVYRTNESDNPFCPCLYELLCLVLIYTTRT
jgi:hypothetical protein